MDEKKGIEAIPFFIAIILVSEYNEYVKSKTVVRQ